MWRALFNKCAAFQIQLLFKSWILVSSFLFSMWTIEEFCVVVVFTELILMIPSQNEKSVILKPSISIFPIRAQVTSHKWCGKLVYWLDPFLPFQYKQTVQTHLNSPNEELNNVMNRFIGDTNTDEGIKTEFLFHTLFFNKITVLFIYFDGDVKDT